MAKQGVHVLVEHKEPLDRDRVLRLFECCGPERYAWRGAKIAPGERERWVGAAEKVHWSQAYAWDVAGPDGGPARVNFALQATAIPLRGASPASWLHVVCDVTFELAADTDWLAGYLSGIAKAFTIPFAFADSEHHLRANAEADPRRLVWPIMLLGPNHVQKLGELRVRASPGVVREVAPETFLVQVSEAPLASRARTLDALAAHLGRAARK